MFGPGVAITGSLLVNWSITTGGMLCSDTTVLWSMRTATTKTLVEGLLESGATIKAEHVPGCSAFVCPAGKMRYPILWLD